MLNGVHILVVVRQTALVQVRLGYVRLGYRDRRLRNEKTWVKVDLGQGPVWASAPVVKSPKLLP